MPLKEPVKNWRESENEISLKWPSSNKVVIKVVAELLNLNCAPAARGYRQTEKRRKDQIHILF
jgi:hypothetical protein